MLRIYNKTGVTKSVVSTIFAASSFTLFLCNNCGSGDDNNANYGETINYGYEEEENGNIKATTTVESTTPEGKKVVTNVRSRENINLAPVSNHQKIQVNGNFGTSSGNVVVEVQEELDIMTKINNADLNSGAWWNILNPTGQQFITLTQNLHIVTSTNNNIAYLDEYNLDKHKIASMIKEIEAIEVKPAQSSDDKMRLVYLYNRIIQILSSKIYIKDNDKAFISNKTATKLISELNKDKIKAGAISENPTNALTLKNIAANYGTELKDLKTYLSAAPNNNIVSVKSMIEMIDGILSNNPASLTKYSANAKQIYDDVKSINGLSAAQGAPAQDTNRNYYVDTMKVVILAIPNAVCPDFAAQKHFPIATKK